MIIKSDANIPRRFLAGLIDYMLIFCFTIIYMGLFGETNDEGGYSVSGFMALGPVLGWAFLTVGLEQWFGRTLGNSLSELKPISINGLWEKPSFFQSLKRHLLDPVDMFFFGLVAIIVISSTERKQRLGDVWASTTVIRTN